MAPGSDFTTTALAVIGPTELRLRRSGPAPALPPLAPGPLGLRPALDSGTGPFRVALSLRLLRPNGAPLTGALALLRLEEAPADTDLPPPASRMAAQVADDVGFLCFVWSQASLAAACRPLLCLDIHLPDAGGAAASASTRLRLGPPADPQARHGVARARIQLLDESPP